MVLAGLTGCWQNNNLDIQQIDQQAKSLRTHLYEISGENGFYENEKIDFSMLKQIKTITQERLNSVLTQFEDEKVTQDTMDHALEKGSTLMYFIWMEEIDAAKRNNNSDNLRFVGQEHKSFVEQKQVKIWLDSTGKKLYSQAIQEYMDNIPTLLEQAKTIEENNSQLNTLKNNAQKFKDENNIVEYNRLVDEYNTLLEVTNNLIDEYNQQLEKYNYETLYNNFMNMIDVSYIFPGQKTIPLEK